MIEEKIAIKKPLVSIVVPCYNVEEFVKQCVDSVVGQSFDDIEIILVNDGSTDGTLGILKSYADEDNRVTVIDLENGGYGRAVNFGISKTQGEYIGIVESDDFIHRDMYKTLYGLSKNGTVDVVKGNFYDFYALKGKVPEVFVNNERGAMPDIDEPFVLLDQPEILWGHPSVWSGIYRSEFLLEQGIVFKEEKGGGWVDNPFFFETLCKAKSIMWTKTPLYFYRKTNENSSSKKFMNPVLPFDRMEDNLDVLERENCTDKAILRRAYARAMMYAEGAKIECDYNTNDVIIDERSSQLMLRLNYDVILSDFNLHDQRRYFELLQPWRCFQAETPKILLYNWLPFDNQWGYGGGVTIYCKNVIEQLLKDYPFCQIYFISSGFAYKADELKTYIRKIPNVFGDRVIQFEVVNSPIPAEQRNIYKNPLVALENKGLKDVFANFIRAHGEFSVIHFNNIEGISLDVFDLKQDFPNTKFIFSIHNYVPMCVTGFYYMRHKHCNCSPEHTGLDCLKCVNVDIGSNFAKATYERGLYGIDPKTAVLQNKWVKYFGFERLDEQVSQDEISLFTRAATEKINKNCDTILAVAKRVRDIAIAEGFDKNKTVVSYIGTKVAECQIKRANATPSDGLKIVFLGSNVTYEEKGYPFLLETLEQLDEQYAAKIDLVLTMRGEYPQIPEMLSHFRSVKCINGYTHDDLPYILKNCHLGIVPVLWEDNLPQISIEMVAYGVPVLSSDAGGASELCESNLFKFRHGNSEELREKIVFFLQNPEKLKEYWTYHNGLVTMKEHITELLKHYKLPKSPSSIKISPRVLEVLGAEREWLKKNISLNEGKYVPQSVIDDLRHKLYESEKRSEILKRKLEEEQVRSFSFRGKTTFHTDYEPYMGHVGANLFRIILEKFDFSDFYAEIRFIKLRNIRSSASDVLHISGTWMKDGESYKLQLHQAAWKAQDPEITEWIYFYIKENAVYFFGRYPGKYSGFDFEILTLTSRAAGYKTVKPELICSDYTDENEVRPDDARCVKDVIMAEKSIEQEDCNEVAVFS